MNIENIFDKVNTGVGQVLLAFLGGLISVLMRKEVSSWRAALLAATGAGFAGFLVAHLCHAVDLSDDWTYVFVGVSGWLGAARTLSYLEAIFDARFRIDSNKPPVAGGEGATDAPAAPASDNNTAAPTSREPS